MRSQINPAPYNPRKIDAYARKQLRNSLDQFSLVEAIVWNETTGNLVSGHQRLSLIDEQEGWPGKDYRIGACVIRASLKKEQKLNVWLNNTAAQGHYDKDRFEELLKSDDFKIEDFGFSMVDIQFEFGELDGLVDPATKRENEAAAAVVASAEEIDRKRKETRAKRNALEAAGDADPRNDVDYMLMVVWPSGKEKMEWLCRHGILPNAAYVGIEEIEMAITETVAG